MTNIGIEISSTCDGTASNCKPPCTQIIPIDLLLFDWKLIYSFFHMDLNKQPFLLYQ